MLFFTRPLILKSVETLLGVQYTKSRCWKPFQVSSCLLLAGFTVSHIRLLSIGGFHAISGDTNNNGEMNKCWWTNKTS